MGFHSRDRAEFWQISELEGNHCYNCRNLAWWWDETDLTHNTIIYKFVELWKKYFFYIYSSWLQCNAFNWKWNHESIWVKLHWRQMKLILRYVQGLNKVMKQRFPSHHFTWPDMSSHQASLECELRQKRRVILIVITPATYFPKPQYPRRMCSTCSTAGWVELFSLNID